MAHQTQSLAVDERIEKLLHLDRPRYRRLWMYYRNPMRLSAVDADDSQGSGRPYRQAQEWGLPSRITGVRSGASVDEIFGAARVAGVARKEIVIENDIGWRIDTMGDFLFGKALVIESAAEDPTRRQQIARLLRLILSHNGGIVFLQQLALLGSVYGFVDVLVKLSGDCGEPIETPPASSNSSCGAQELGQPPVSVDEPTVPPLAEPAPRDDESPTDSGASEPSPDARLQRIARLIRLEIVEPARALPFLSLADWRVVSTYGQCYELPKPRAKTDTPREGWLARWRRFTGSNLLRADDDQSLVLELITPERWQRYEDQALVAQGDNSLGQIPLVHIQNTAMPFEYSGLSDVESLIPLQDELNTRLSDRANRLALQSFKMYLGKNIDGFTELPVAPGRMWMTDNDRADVIEFGGDSSSPSEDAHIAEVREALDKASGVTPIAAGAIKGRIGRLTSAAALRVTMQALLAKTDKKRTTYGLAIQRICELALAWLDKAGIFPTDPQERGVELHWPSPLPENELEKLQEAEAKARLGVPREVLMRELGY